MLLVRPCARGVLPLAPQRARSTRPQPLAPTSDLSPLSAQAGRAPMTRTPGAGDRPAGATIHRGGDRHGTQRADPHTRRGAWADAGG